MARDKVVIDIEAKDKTSKGVKKVEGSFKSLSKTIGPLIAAGFGVAAVKSATDAFIRQENAVKQLEQRLKSTRGVVGLTSDELQRMASGLQDVTTFGDEAIIEMQSLLLTFTKIGGDTFPAATEAILNVSTAMGQDLQTAAIQVGKALNDPVAGISALSRSGIQFSESQKATIKSLSDMGDVAGAQAIILKELETQFGGAARAARDTLGGALQSLSNTFGDVVLEGLGSGGQGLIPLLQDLEEILKSPEFKSGISSLAGGINDIAFAMAAIASVGRGATESLGDFGVEARDVLEFLAPALKTLRQFREFSEAREGRRAVPELTPENRAFQEQFEAQRNQQQQTEELTQESLDVELDMLMNQLAAKEAIWAVETEQRQAQNDAQVAAYEAKTQAEIAIERMRGEAISGILANVSSLMGSESRKAFEIGKAASIAQATIKTYESATSAYSALAGIPIVGPGLGIAAAAAAVAAGLSNVQKIASTSFQGGATGQAQVPSIGGAGGVVGPVGQPQPILPTSPQGSGLEIRTGGFLGDWLENEFAPAWADAQARGVKLVIA